MSIFGPKNFGKMQSKIGTPKIDAFFKFRALLKCVNLWRRTVYKKTQMEFFVNLGAVLELWPLILAILVVAEIFVLVMVFVLGDQWSGILWPETRNFELQDVDVLRGPDRRGWLLTLHVAFTICNWSYGCLNNCFVLVVTFFNLFFFWWYIMVLYST